MIVLDTNVLSALMRKIPEPEVVHWLDAQPGERIWTSSVSVYEIRFGLNILEDGRRKQQLQQAFEALVSDDLAKRILDLDAAAASEAALMSAEARRTGRSIEIRAALIAGSVRSRRAVLATCNIKHFQNTDITLINPWAAE